MKVSVVIPIFNAMTFIRQAALSALQQNETAELILVDDGSEDGSLEFCIELAKSDVRVRLLHHANNENHGVSASRNLGIKNAKCDFITWIDADDYMLPDRFAEPKRLFAEDTLLEGVYEAMGFHIDDAQVFDKYLMQLTDPNQSLLTTMKKKVSPEKLFEFQSPVGEFGYCPTGGWIVRKNIFEKTGLFDENLHIHEDTVMYVKFAAVGRMKPGILDKPVAMRRVHHQNTTSISRSPVKAYLDRLLMWETLWFWSKKWLGTKKKQVLFRKYVEFAARPIYEANSIILNNVISLLQILRLVLRHPSLLTEWENWRTVFRHHRGRLYLP